jgi:hypothetical protein
MGSDPLAGIDDLPWKRIVHVYGRAAKIPSAIRQLGTDDHAAAEEELLRFLEHQDSLSQATPFAVFFILKLLRAGQVRDPVKVTRLLKVIGTAARFTIEANRELKQALGWNALLAEERLWPEFKSARDDEIMSEEWNPPPEESVGWAVLTNQLLSQVPGEYNT